MAPPFPPPSPRQTTAKPVSDPSRQSARDVINIVVMVGGTVDPVNTDSKARSASYHSPSLPMPTGPNPNNDSNWYWGDNKELRDSLTALQKKYRNLHLFVAHGWTGDNCPSNRRIAGAYLADRLCGGNGEKSYYPAYLHQEVSFHLIGHSHGGNVINELTQRAATSKSWPKHWKIRSITYLSTPFFTRLHKVNTGTFDKDCRILNVYCKYDLTQRVIADFSMKPLGDLLAQVDGSELMTRISEVDFKFSLIQEALLSGHVQITSGHWYHLDPNVFMDASKGATLYKAVLGTLNQVHAVFGKVRELVDRFNKGVDYPVPKELDKKLKQHRQVMSDTLAAKFKLRLDEIEQGLQKTQAAFTARMKGGKYPQKGFFEDLHFTAFLVPLVNFLSVERNSLRGPLWDLVCELIKEQIDEFDNTVTSPAGQLKGSPFAARIVDLPITDKDPYFGKHEAAFNTFISRMEGIEARITQSSAQSQFALRDLVFTLIAQMEPLRTWVAKSATAVDAFERLKMGPETDQDKVFLRLVQMVESYAFIFKARDCGPLEVKDPSWDRSAGQPALGSIPYFAVFAHSTSRQRLYPKVKDALEGQFNTLPRAGG